LGSDERADEIGKSLQNPIMSWLARKAFSDCGNCANRYTCTKEIIDIPKALEYLTNDEAPEPTNLSLMSRTTAQIFDERCRYCIHLKGCINKWFTSDKEQAKGIAEQLRELPKENMTILINGILKDQNLTTIRITFRLVKLWTKCWLNGMETNAVKMMKG